MELLMPSAGFDDPLALLSACHQRIEGFCITLERLVTHLELVGSDVEARNAAQRVISYFVEAAPHHHADEEVDLLPLLRLRVEAEGISTIENWADRISADHNALDPVWIELQVELQKIVNGEGNRLDAAMKFIEMERKHYQFEDQNVFPLAGRILQKQDLKKLGRAMANRRKSPYLEDV